jgi:hypothetical protein
MVFPDRLRQIGPVLALGMAGIWLNATSAPVAPPAPEFSTLTDVMVQDIDPDAFRQWVDGAEGPITPAVQFYGMNILHEAIWTHDLAKGFGYPAGRDIHFGDSKTPGPRHLRIGFTRAIPVGTIIGAPSVRVSVLKPDVPYPGNLGDDSQWIPAERIETTWNSVDQREERKVTSDANVLQNKIAFWVLPPGTVTRALRFTHVADPSDGRTFMATMEPVCVLSKRCIDAAGLADVRASTGQDIAYNLISTGVWGAWRSNPDDSSTNVVTPDHPDTVVLVWPKPIEVKNFLLWNSSFLTAEAGVYTATGEGLRAHDILKSSDWKTVQTIDNPNGMLEAVDLGGVKTRAIRLRITQPLVATHDTIAGHRASQNGKLVQIWQGLVPMEIGDQPLASLLPEEKAIATHPPIPVRFTLAEPGYVTLVIEDSTGKRVRNLVSETQFPAGENTVWWDGMDDLGRDPEAAQHSIYRVFGNWVTPGTYTVRGLYRKEITLHYQMDVNNPGKPPWLTADGTGGWLADHGAPDSAVFLPGATPQMALGSALAENANDLILTDLEGHKMWGTHFASGVWRGVSLLARDVGDQPVAPPGQKVPSVLYLAESDTDKDKNIVLILNAQSDLAPNSTGALVRQSMAILPLAADCVVSPPATTPDAHQPIPWVFGGMAVRNGLVALSLVPVNKIVFIDAAQAKIVGEAPLDSPRGVAFDSQGRLLVISGTKLLRFPPPVVGPGFKLGTAETIVADGLEDPFALTLDDAGTIYVTDWGQSNQVKVFTPQGKLVRAIGHPGPAAQPGPYDRLHMNNPKGVAVDGNGRIWIAEESFTPKRISVWNADGTLDKAFYGPDEYAGGGSIDPQDKTLFYYRDMQFKLDWDKGTSEPSAIISPPGPWDTVQFHNGMWHWLGRPVHYNGRCYLTDTFQGGVDVSGAPVTFLFELRNSIAVPVAAVGAARDWPLLLGNDYRTMFGWPTLPFDFASIWPPNLAVILHHPPKPTDWPGKFRGALEGADFAWSDLNGDGKVEPDEIKVFEGNYGPCFTLQDDLSVISSYGVKFAPVRFTDRGAPVYDITKGEMLVPPAGANLGNTQVLLDKNGWLFMTTAPKPFPPESLGGAKNGRSMWSYPDLWPGIHPSHVAPQPTFPGELVGRGHLMGGFITPKGSDVGAIAAMTSNLGNVYLFSSDGLFVATLFRNTWDKGPWAMPQATKDMDVTNTGHWTEDFLPTINQLEDGTIYLVAEPQHSSIIRVDGLESVRRIAPLPLVVTPGLLAKAQDYNLRAAADLIQERGRDSVDVPILPAPPKVDGKLDEWDTADWATIDVQNDAVGNWGSTTHVNRAALAVSGDRLYVAFDVHNPGLLINTDEDLKALFKTGGALDLMIGADPNADPKRVNPVPGDIRLLVTQKTMPGNKKETVAAVFRAVVPGAKNPVPFSSPSRTITFDAVDDVSSQVELAGVDGSYELSIPLAVLGLHPVPGQVIRGDIGILRGNGFQTIRRSYWQNKATGLVADVPGEAQLTPQLWGTFKFVAPAPVPASVPAR